MDIYVKQFAGLQTKYEDEATERGSASSSNNWVTKTDHIELRLGQQVMGTTVAGVGKISGLRVGSRFDGTDVVIQTQQRKVKYYDETTEDWIEAGPDVLPAAASGEDMAIDVYQGLAGGWFYLTSKNSSWYKIPIANPDSVVDLNVTSHRGKIRIKQNRSFLWGRKDTAGGFDNTGLYDSYIDKDELSDYTAVSSESIGSSGSVNYNGTLAFKGGGATRTCMFVSITDGVETFRDDRDGLLVGSLGGTGTINYATGDYDVNFNSAAAGSVTADYYYETSTSTGIVDFSHSTPRTAGQGGSFRQDEGGGDMQNLFSIGSAEYCMHTRKTWKLTIGSDDTDATNLIYRNKVGIPYWRAGCETGDGIYFVDAIDILDPQIRILEEGYNNPNVLPRSISKDLDLSAYRFDQSAIWEWGFYILVACRTSDSTINNTVLAYDRSRKSWDIHDFRVAMFDVKNGALIAGDSGSYNVYTLFSGLTDDEVEIPNHWTSNKDRLNVEGTKQFNIFKVKGLIGLDQEYDVEHSYDNGEFVKVYTISGQGSYVDRTQRTVVGPHTLGKNELGGGGTGIEAYPYEKEFRVTTPRFEGYRVRYIAKKIGYLSITEYAAKDVRRKGRRILPQYSTGT